MKVKLAVAGAAVLMAAGCGLPGEDPTIEVRQSAVPGVSESSLRTPDYIAGAELEELDSPAEAYKTNRNTDPQGDIEILKEQFGFQTDPVSQGPDEWEIDGETGTVGLSTRPLRNWWFRGDDACTGVAAEELTEAGDPTAIATPSAAVPSGDLDDPVANDDSQNSECGDPPKESDLPSDEEAELLARNFFADLEVPEQAEATTVRGITGVGVTLTTLLGGVPNPYGSQMRFGADGAVLEASGDFAVWDRAGAYDLIGAEAALQRLKDGEGVPFWRADWVGGASDSETDSATLVEVDAGYLPVEDVEGITWLLPSYVFTDDAGYQHAVLGIDKDYLTVPSGSGEEPTLITPSDPSESPVPEEYVGLSEEDAKELAESRGLTPRVVARDGEAFAVTEDYRTDRVNFTIEDGNVTEATIG